MAGKLCPNCGEYTFFKTTDGGRKCTKCGHTMTIPVGKGGRGRKCSNCGSFTVFNTSLQLFKVLEK